MNENWTKWIIASLSRYFEQGLSPIKVYLEGQRRDTTKEESYVELRITDFNTLEASKNYFYIVADIDILCVCVKNSNIYTIPALLGKVVTLANNSIEVYKYGEESADLLGCLRLIPSARGGDMVKVTNYGQVAPSIDILQSTVAASYQIELES